MELKFHFFPAAFPDETLHSVLSRYAQLCGGSSRRAAFAGERAAASFTQNVAFPSRLGDLVGALPPGTDLSVAQIIKRHSVLPYYAPFLTNDQLQYAHSSMAGDGRGLMLMLGVNASRVEGAARVRFCPSCLTDDISRFGAAYWHRVHQLPGVLVCPQHSQLLKVVDPSWYSRNSQQLNLPGDDGVQAHAIQLNAGVHTLPKLHQIACGSLQLLGLERGPLPATAVRAFLLQAAVDLGLTSGAAHRLDLRRLASHMASLFKFLPADWEYSVLRKAPPGLPATWVTKLLRTPRGTHHPLKYLVLANALGVDLTCIPCVDKPAEPEREGPSHPGTRTSRTVTTEPVTDGLKGLAAAIWKLALTGEDAAQIAGMLGVSQTQVYRTICAVNRGPSEWKEARFVRERRRRRESFEDEYGGLQAHQCRDYPWLYRCDRMWVSSWIAKYGNRCTSRPGSAGMFAALDVQLAEEIRCCAQRLRAESGKPIRISRTRIGRELHVLARFEKQLSKLPLCKRELIQVCESAEQFRTRRLLWAEAKLLHEQRNVTRSVLYRTACIRPGI